jgi:hypothetical protein
VSARAGQEQILWAHLSVTFSKIASGMTSGAKVSRKKAGGCACGQPPAYSHDTLAYITSVICHYLRRRRMTKVKWKAENK